MLTRSAHLDPSACFLSTRGARSLTNSALLPEFARCASFLKSLVFAANSLGRGAKAPSYPSSLVVLHFSSPSFLLRILSGAGRQGTLAAPERIRSKNERLSAQSFVRRYEMMRDIVTDRAPRAFKEQA